MKIEVGMYVRTKYGIKNIHSIDEYKTKWKYYYKLKKQDGDGCNDLGVLCKEDIIGEPSYNPIYLIKVGDYVNGLLVTRICEDAETNKKYINLYGSISEWEEEDIKSIVTKEQFEKERYVIGE